MAETLSECACTSNDTDPVLNHTVEIFEHLAIDYNYGLSFVKNSKVGICVKPSTHTTWKRKLKWAPYAIPRIRKIDLKTRDILFSAMERIRLSGDVECLKLCLLDRREFPIPCSLQAARPPTPDGEVDELTEYFAHFVRVNPKMSALAESMYA